MMRTPHECYRRPLSSTADHQELLPVQTAAEMEVWCVQYASRSPGDPRGVCVAEAQPSHPIVIEGAQERIPLQRRSLQTCMLGHDRSVEQAITLTDNPGEEKNEPRERKRYHGHLVSYRMNWNSTQTIGRLKLCEQEIDFEEI